MSTEIRLERPFFLTLFVGTLFLAAYIFRFYLTPVLFGIAFAVVFYPLYCWVTRVLGGIRGLAAFLVVAVVLITGLVPLSFVALRVANDAADAYTRLAVQHEASGILGVAVGFLSRNIPYASAADVETYVGNLLKWVVEHMSGIFSSTVRFAGNLFLGLLAAYYFLKDGERMAGWLMRLSPFESEKNKTIAESLRLTVNSVIRGTLVVALLQGILAGVGFAVFGIPQPTFWGLVTVIAALVPLVGTSLVVIPAVAYAFFFIAPAAAIGIFLWGMVLVGLVDNLLRPQLIERGIKIHPFLILLSVLGGIASFGLAGFLLGPLVLSFLSVLVRMYPPLMLGVNPRGNGIGD